MLYLPDKPDNTLDRQYLFAIVNTLDHTFFPRLKVELSTPRKLESNTKKETVRVDKNIFLLLQKAIAEPPLHSRVKKP